VKYIYVYSHNETLQSTTHNVLRKIANELFCSLLRFLEMGIIKAINDLITPPSVTLDGVIDSFYSTD
jgi:hypothetical protein